MKKLFILSLILFEFSLLGGPGPGGNGRLDSLRMPLHFICNQGQVNERALFYLRTPAYSLWVTRDSLVFDSFIGREPGTRKVTRLLFAGANPRVKVVPLEMSAHRVNYFIGSDRSKWHTDIPTSKAVLYREIYPGIDLKLYVKEQQIEYDWIVKPAGDPAKINMVYQEVKSARLDRAGNLVLETGFGKLMHKRPAGYLERGKEQRAADRWCRTEGREHRINVGVEFKELAKNTYGFKVGEFDKSGELIIDPLVLVYSSYLGGYSNDRSYSIAADGSGHVFIAGRTYSPDFPLQNHYQDNRMGCDAFLARLDLNQSGGASLVYSTYLGGNNFDISYEIALAGPGQVVVTGYTNSTDFPRLNHYQDYQGDCDVFVTKLDTNRSGAASLVYSTYLGGEGFDYGSGTAVDGSGYVYVVGHTASTDFPVLNQYQGDQGGEDVFVTKLDTNKSGAASLVYSTYLGGGDDDYGFSTAVDSSGYVYVSGKTHSADFPIRNQYQQDQDYEDAFVTKLDTTRSGDASLVYSTYLGGEDEDYCNNLAVAGSGQVYLTGFTHSVDFPVRKQYQVHQADYDAFVTRLDTTCSGSASLIYSTYLGGNHTDYGIDIAVDGCENVYVTGYTNGDDFPVLNQYQDYQGDFDAFITRLDTRRSGSASLVYSTYLAGSDWDKGESIAAGSLGDVYVTGYTWSRDFPVHNQFQDYQGGSDAFIARLNFSSADIAVSKNVDDLSAEQGDDVVFTIEASNNGPAHASGLKVRDRLPAGLAFVSASASRGHYNHSRGTWDIGNLIAGKNTKLEIRARVTGSTPITNRAELMRLNEYDPNTANNQAEVTIKPNIPPMLSFITPLDHEVVCGKVRVEVSASDDSQVSKLDLNIDGALKYTGTVAPYIYDWDSLNYPNGIHRLKAAAYDDQGATASAQIEVNVQNVIIILAVSKREERAWIVRRVFAAINLDVENPANFPLSKLLVYRKESGHEYQLIKEILTEEFPAGIYTFNDLYLQENKSYVYRAEALDLEGNVIGVSREQDPGK